ncbi:MAG TPA: hypothetical protein VK152_10520 [Paludibacter sp.]|nr:hypothetical protein [Paludibacter sp.]
MKINILFKNAFPTFSRQTIAVYDTNRQLCVPVLRIVKDNIETTSFAEALKVLESMLGVPSEIIKP